MYIIKETMTYHYVNYTQSLTKTIKMIINTMANICIFDTANIMNIFNTLYKEPCIIRLKEKIYIFWEAVIERYVEVKVEVEASPNI